MKPKIILMMFSLVALFACSVDADRSFVTGIYVNSSAGEYSVADDTLVIEALKADRFTIHRKTGFNLIRNGRMGKREHETELWNGIYDKKTGVLTETRKGRVLLFYPDSAKLMIGSRSYQKTN